LLLPEPKFPLGNPVLVASGSLRTWKGHSRETLRGIMLDVLGIFLSTGLARRVDVPSMRLKVRFLKKVRRECVEVGAGYEPRTHPRRYVL
jgi:hypothetical protein